MTDKSKFYPLMYSYRTHRHNGFDFEFNICPSAWWFPCLRRSGRGLSWRNLGLHLWRQLGRTRGTSSVWNAGIQQVQDQLRASIFIRNTIFSRYFKSIFQLINYYMFFPIFRSGSGGAQGGLFGAAPTYAKIFMDEVNCTGTEASIDLCHFNGWGVHDCGHDEDAGVICNSGKPF